MSLRGSQPDPYTESGGDASLREVRRMRRAALTSSLSDADGLRLRGREVIRRGRRQSVMAVGLVLSWVALVFLLVGAAMRGYDGTPEGMMISNWSTVGVVVAIGGLHFSWGWFTSRLRLCDTGRRLIRRAEYQRRLATLQLKEADREALR